MEFLWYYYAVAQQAIWDVLVIDYAGALMCEKMAKYCENAGIFNNVTLAQKGLIYGSSAEKLSVVSRMLVSFISGKGDQYAKTILSRDFCWDDYDEFVVTANPGLVAGCLVRLSKDKRTVLFEDGFADYQPKRRWCGFENIFDISQVVGMITSFLGFGTGVVGYRLKNYKYCIHYSTFPDKLVYKEYAEVNEFYKEPLRNGRSMKEVVREVFEVPEDIDFSKFDMVLFTSAYENASYAKTVSQKGVYEAIHNWIVDSYGQDIRILVKRHPRDTYDYGKWADLVLSFVDSSIPGEVIVPFCAGKTVVLANDSGVMFQLAQHGIDYIVLDSGKYVKRYFAEAQRRNIEKFDARSVVI